MRGEQPWRTNRASHKAIVEVGGGTHSAGASTRKTQKRMSALRSLRYRTFRFGSDDVHHDIDCTLHALSASIDEGSKKSGG